MATNEYLNICKNHQPSHSSKTNQLALFGHALLPSVVFSVGEVMAAVGHRGARFESAELQVTRCSGAARVYLLLYLECTSAYTWYTSASLDARQTVRGLHLSFVRASQPFTWFHSLQANK